nr:hypothetical protein [Lysobacter dokdonensis]
MRARPRGRRTRAGRERTRPVAPGVVSPPRPPRHQARLTWRLPSPAVA